ncbi:MAG: tail fiber domain-containing protein [Phycisphaerales bacterium]|nr:tail fiber domain-containing protein [Phycisphaerales bacterium]
MFAHRFAAALVVGVAYVCAPIAQAQTSTAFTYQGRLTNGGLPANGTFDVRFRLLTASSGGAQLGGTQCFDQVAVSKGIFTLTLDFGAQFNGATRWLEVSVRQDAVTGNCSTGAFTTLSPRQAVTGAPQSAIAVQGSRADATPFDITVNGRRSGRYTYATTGGASGFLSSNYLGGASVNTMSAASVGSVIAGGGSVGINNADLPNSIDGSFAAISGGEFNIVNAAHAAIGGGFNNTINASASEAFIGGGVSNTASGAYNVIGGGSNNMTSASAATIGGGENNTVSGNGSTVGGGISCAASNNNTTVAGGSNCRALDQYDTVGGGQNNTADGFNATVCGGAGNMATSGQAFVGGGSSNIASQVFSTVAGGASNQATGSGATVGGGGANLASGQYSTVPGGFECQALGSDSFAAGYKSIAGYDGSFVWSDQSQSFGNGASRANTFNVRAAGGTFVSGGGLAVVGGASPYPFGTRGIFVEGFSSFGSIFAYDYFNSTARPLILNAPGGTVGIGTLSPSASYTLHVNGPVAGVGAYNALSDARYKTNIHTIDDGLAQVLQMRGVSFDWDEAAMKAKGYHMQGGRQLGVIAQEVEEVAPELVTTADDGDKSVAYDNITPMLIEAIKAQQKQIEALQARLAELERK